MIERETPSRDMGLAVQRSGPVVDRVMLGGVTLDSLALTVVEDYRRDFAANNPDHPWTNLNDLDFLVRIGAVVDAAEDAPFLVTSAGLLMFGHEHEVRTFFPHYLLDCRFGVRDGAWKSRLISNSGQTSGALYAFYRDADDRISTMIDEMSDIGADVRSDLKGMAREGLVNALVHADYDGRRHVVVEQYDDRIVFANPGRLLVDRMTAERGGVSDPRNPALMKMFFLVGAARDAGAGIPLMFRTAREAGLADPVLSSDCAWDRTELRLFLRSGRSTSSDVVSSDEAESTAIPQREEENERIEPPPRPVELPARFSYSVEPFRSHESEASRYEVNKAAEPRSQLDEEVSDRVADIVDGLDSESADVVRLIAAKHRIKRSEVQEELGVGSTKAKQLLASLVIQGVVRTEGNGRGTNYVLS